MAVPPTVFHKYDGLLPENYRPSMHINYENRMMDSLDDLPKYRVRFGIDLSASATTSTFDLPPSRLFFIWRSP
jgi:hypothetical protein